MLTLALLLIFLFKKDQAILAINHHSESKAATTIEPLQSTSSKQKSHYTVLSDANQHVHSRYHIHASSIHNTPEINHTGLSVTSIVYNDKPTSIPWLSKIIGDESVFINPMQYPFWKHNKRQIFPLEALNSISLNGSRLKPNISNSEYNAKCSFEILGFTGVQSNDPRLENFLREHKDRSPIFGKARLDNLITNDSHLELLSNSVPCYYRALHTKWSKPFHYAIVTYCPITEISHCNRINQQLQWNSNEGKDMHLLFHLKLTIDRWSKSSLFENWTANILTKLFRRNQQDLPNHNTALHNFDNQTHNQLTVPPNRGVCLSIPFRTVNDSMFAVHGAMISEWIRYYNLLGFKVFVYDSYGKFEKHIFKSTAYNQANKINHHNHHSGHKRRINTKSNRRMDVMLYYFNYTIYELLHPEVKLKSFDFADSRIANVEIYGQYTVFSSLLFLKNSVLLFRLILFLV